jgi:hypothetical protein
MTIWIPLFSYFFYQFTRESFWAISTITIVNRRLRDIKYVFIIRIPFLRWINLRPTISAVQAKRIPIVPVRLHSFLLFLLFLLFFFFSFSLKSSAAAHQITISDFRTLLFCVFSFSAIFITFRHLPIDLRNQQTKKKKSLPPTTTSFVLGRQRSALLCGTQLE